MNILKFGGTSLGSADNLANSLAIIERSAASGQTWVVVSALGESTNRLEAALLLAAGGSTAWRATVEELRRDHTRLFNSQAGESERRLLVHYLDQQLLALTRRLTGVQLLREISPKVRDLVLSSGEYLAAELVAAALRGRGLPTVALDPAGLIRTDERHGRAAVNAAATRNLVQQVLVHLPVKNIAVVGGFIGGSERGVLTTLGRGGSDYSAAVLAAASDAQVLEIWTDVDGVLTADPGVVSRAQTLSEISYNEASELALLGARVLHPRTLQPLEQQGIPLVVRNTARPEAPGTRITGQSAARSGNLLAVTSLHHLSLLEVRVLPPREVGRTAARVYSALEREEVETLFGDADPVSQLVRLLIRPEESTLVREALQREFSRDSAGGSVQINPQEPVALVSLSVNELPQSQLLRLMLQLEEQGIEILFSPGRSTQRRVQWVVDEQVAGKLVKLLHRMLEEQFSPEPFRLPLPRAANES